MHLIKNKSSRVVTRRPNFFLLIQTHFLVCLLCYIGNNNQQKTTNLHKYHEIEFPRALPTTHQGGKGKKEKEDEEERFPNRAIKVTET